MIYLDNSATTLMSEEALRTYSEVARRFIGNPSSLHGLGATANRLLEASRRQIAELLSGDLDNGAAIRPEEIFFTSGGTESDNWAIKGTAWEKAKFGKHILISSIEHPAVKEAAKWLATQGFEVEEIPVSAEGFVKAETVREMLRDDTILLSIMAVNNEVGSVQNLAEISKVLADRPNITFHVDAVQAIGKISLADFILPRVDLLSLSAHKFHGPRGLGILVVKSGKRLTPLLHGGGQEKNLRSTTENLPAIAATAKALRLTLEKQELAVPRLSQMKEIMLSELAKHDNVLIFSGLEHFTSNILTWGIRGIRGEVLVHAFEQHEIYLSTTSACSSKKNAASSTLIAMQVKPELATTAVRVSLDESNTMIEIENFLTVARQIIDQLG